MKRDKFVALILAIVGLSANGIADSAIPAHIKEKLDGFVGTWEYEQEIRQTQSSDWEKSTGSWSSHWVYDYLIETRGGGGSAIQYTGYDPMMQIYSYWFQSDGTHGRFVDGYWDGNTWYLDNFGIEDNGVPWRGRCSFPFNDDFTAIMNYQCEALEDGDWYVWRKGSAKKVKQ